MIRLRRVHHLQNPPNSVESLPSPAAIMTCVGWNVPGCAASDCAAGCAAGCGADSAAGCAAGCAAGAGCRPANGAASGGGAVRGCRGDGERVSGPCDDLLRLGMVTLAEVTEVGTANVLVWNGLNLWMLTPSTPKYLGNFLINGPSLLVWESYQARGKSRTFYPDAHLHHLPRNMCLRRHECLPGKACTNGFETYHEVVALLSSDEVEMRDSEFVLHR